MGYNIGPTIAVKGESEYNAAIKKISTNMKLVASEAGRMTAEFGKNNTSTEALRQKGENLNKALKLQEQAVNHAEDALKKMRENGVDESSTAYVQLETNLNQAKTALANTKTEVKENEEELKKGNKEVKDHSEAWQKFGSGAAKVAVASLKAIAVSMAAIATGAVIVGKKIFELTKSSGEWADQLQTTSKQTDISTETLQGLSYAARFVDTDLEDMTKGMGKVVTSMREASKQGADYITIADGMNVSMRDQNGQMKSTEQMFYDTVDALKAIEDPTKRDIAAQEVFGKSYQDMKPLIDAGSGALKKYASEAQSAGLILSNEAVNALAGFDDQMQRTNARMETAGRLAALVFLPAVQSVAGGVSEILSAVTTALQDGFQESDVSTISNAITTQIQNALSAVQQNAPAFITVITNVLSTLLNTAVTTLPTLLPVLVESATGLLSSVLAAVQANTEPISAAALQIVDLLVTFFTDNIPLIIDTGLTLLISLMNGLVQNVPKMIPKIVSMVTKIAQLITEPNTLSKLVVASVQIMAELAVGMVQAIPQLLKAVPQIISSLVQAFGQAAPQILDIGKYLVSGIWEGISGSISWIYGKIKGWVSSVLSYIKKLFGIHSPSTVMRDQVGKYLAMGLGEGITNNSGYAKSAMKGLMGDVMGETYNPSIIANVTGRMASNKSSSASSSSPINITIPVTLDGREIARVTAPYMGEQLSWQGA